MSLLPTGGNTPEVATNANGTYEKYPDGRLICYHTSATTGSTTLATGQVFRSGAQVLTFPHAFSSVPTVLTPGGQYVSGTSLMGTGQAAAATATEVTLRLNSSTNSSQGRPSYYAVGRWFEI